MNAILIVVLLAYLAVHAFEMVLTGINLRYLARFGGEVPVGFEDAVDHGVLVRMRDYTIAKERVGLVGSVVDIVVTIIFLFGGLLDLYNSWLADTGLSQLIVGPLFFLLLSYAGTIIKIPFDLYTTFHVEKKFGFNIQTFGLWLTDLVKGLVLSTVLLGLVLLGAFWLIGNFPRYWWLLTWIFFLGLTVFVMYLSPYVIEPLFNKFTPIADQNLEARIKSVMGKAGLAVSRVFTMDASRRSTHSNAYFTGIGHVKRIVLFDTLLKANTHDEIVAVLAHEAGHWKKKHVIKRLLVMEILALAGSYIASRLVATDWLARLFQLSEPTIYAKLLLVGFIGSLAMFPIKPLASFFSRRHEKEADDFAVRLTGGGRELAQALIKLGRDNLANLHPHPLYAAFYYSHPPLVQRVHALWARQEESAA